MTSAVYEQEHALCAYGTSFEYLADELRRLDLLIRMRVASLRQAWMARAANGTRRAYVADEAVDRLLDQTLAPELAPPLDLRRELEVRTAEINARVRASRDGVVLPLLQLAHTFGLSPFEIQTVVICLAPELDRKYDELYAYLQDDVTRKRPSVELILDLLCSTRAERWSARAYFTGPAALFRFGILRTIDDPQSPSGSSDLARFAALEARILDYLLEHDSIDSRLIGVVTLQHPENPFDDILVEPAVKARLLDIMECHFSAPPTSALPLVLYLHGPYGVGKREAALGMCGRLGCRLLYLDLELLPANEVELELVLRAALREGLLLQAALYFDNLDTILVDEPRAHALWKRLFTLIEECGWLSFLAGHKAWCPAGQRGRLSFRAVEIPVPDVPLREASWRWALARHAPWAEATWPEDLARRFRLTPGQIRDAATDLTQRTAARDGSAVPEIGEVYAACRYQAQHKLGELAAKVDPHYSWQDIVLPDDKLAQLREICGQARQRYRVFREWGFGRKLSHGKGLSVLFSGSSGTGKTMAAEVIAHELQLDLYKIDLSGVVSKYIGETEKNLAQIFAEAESSNAILFFDEADALFGKRTAVSDAHDRYANIETSYLLQKMEEYEGTVILATNLRENIDDAFVRRLRFIVEFPFPDEESRLRIWRQHVPPEAPLSDEIDWEYLAHQLKIAGGSIKNIVLNAAFLAASEGSAIDMRHILHSSKREFEKVGKLWTNNGTKASHAKAN